jgi:hypothetical protein
MTATPLAPAVPELNARGYRRAHAGKLMIIDRTDDRERSAGDFFHVEDVGTHPTGLIVTGIFDGNRRGHMLASSVREADADEIAWRARVHAAARQ